MERDSYCLLVQTPDGRPVCYLLNDDRISIGRGAENHINLSEDPISSNHCEIRFSKNSITLRDLGSKNGTQLNGRLLGEGPEAIRDGDQFVVGLTVQMEFLRLRPVKSAVKKDRAPNGERTGNKSKNKPERPVQVINPVAAAVANATRKLTEQK